MQQQTESEIGTILARGVEFEGQISLDSPILIQADIKGVINSKNDVFISPEALVQSSINARRISVKGKIEGDLVAQERVELFKDSQVSGSITTPDLVMQSGSILNAQINMKKD